MDRSETRGAGDLFHAVLRVRSPSEFNALVTETLHHFCFDFLCLARMPHGDGDYFDNATLFGWREVEPDDLDAARAEAVLARAFRHAGKEVGCLPLRLARTGGIGEAVGESGQLHDFGLGTSEAFFFPVHSPAGGRGVAGFLAGRKWSDEAELAELNYLASALFDRHCRLTRASQRGGKLTRREAECLHWTAAGKTSAEIGTILSLSEHTINNYLVSACHKLDSVNRAHAVAKAIRQGIIS